MKTLDEVIKANECCDHGESDSRCEDCPYNGIGACCAERETDALQWLKGYRAHIELDKLRDKCETENDPLSWDELHTMEGKPVWVEADHAFIQYTGWVLLDKIKEDDPDFTGVEFTCPDRSEFFLLADFIGKTWHAYRKERNAR